MWVYIVFCLHFRFILRKTTISLFFLSLLIAESKKSHLQAPCALHNKANKQTFFSIDIYTHSHTYVVYSVSLFLLLLFIFLFMYLEAVCNINEVTFRFNLTFYTCYVIFIINVAVCFCFFPHFHVTGESCQKKKKGKHVGTRLFRYCIPLLSYMVKNQRARNNG